MASPVSGHTSLELFLTLLSCSNLAIRQCFLLALTGQSAFSDTGRDVMAFPVRLGGLGIINPFQRSEAQNITSEKITAPLVDLILRQSHSYPPEEKAEQLQARRD